MSFYVWIPISSVSVTTSFRSSALPFCSCSSRTFFLVSCLPCFLSSFRPFFLSFVRSFVCSFVRLFVLSPFCPSVLPSIRGLIDFDIQENSRMKDAYSLDYISVRLRLHPTSYNEQNINEGVRVKGYNERDIIAPRSPSLTSLTPLYSLSPNFQHIDLLPSVE